MSFLSLTPFLAGLMFNSDFGGIALIWGFIGESLWLAVPIHIRYENRNFMHTFEATFKEVLWGEDREVNVSEKLQCRLMLA